jgi:plasmid stability protein
VKNITVSVDESTYRKARIEAARRDTSVSALVREYLRTLDSTSRAGNDVEDLFAALDNVKSYRAGQRLSRDKAHER